MDLLDLKVFECVARSGSFSKAAAELRMAQPSVSARMASLEEDVASKLFLRSRRGVSLTHAGQALLPFAERCITSAKEGLAAARATTKRSTVSFAAPALIAAQIFTPILLELSKLPVEVFCRAGHSFEIRQMILDDVVQAGFVMAGPAHKGLHQELLLQDEIVCVAATTHALAANSELTLAELAAAKLAPYDWGPDFNGMMEMLASHGLPPTGMRFIGTMANARELVLQGQFVSVLPRMVVSTELRNGTLKQLHIKGMPRWTWDLALLHRDRKLQDPGLAILLNVLHGIQWDTSTLQKPPIFPSRS